MGEKRLGCWEAVPTRTWGCTLEARLSRGSRLYPPLKVLVERLIAWVAYHPLAAPVLGLFATESTPLKADRDLIPDNIVSSSLVANFLFCVAVSAEAVLLLGVALVLIVNLKLYNVTTDLKRYNLCR